MRTDASRCSNCTGLLETKLGDVAPMRGLPEAVDALPCLLSDGVMPAMGFPSGDL